MARWSLIGAVASGLVALTLTVAQAVLLAHILALAFADQEHHLASDLFLLGVITGLRVIVALVQTPLGIHVAAPVRRDLRRRAVRAVLEHRVSGGTDDTVQLCTRGIDAIETYLAGYVPALVLAVAAPVGLIGWMAMTDWLSAAIVGATILALPIFMVLLGLEAKAKMEERWAEQEKLANYFGDVAAGMATLKAHNRSSHAVRTLDDVGEALQTSTMTTLRVAFLSSFALELLASLATALVAMMLGVRLLGGHMSLSTALAVLIVTPEVYLPLRRAAAQFHASSDGVAAATAVLDLVSEEAAAEGRPAPRNLPVIEFRNARPAITGREHDDLEALCFTIPAGRTTALMGPSGVGKTTLLRCLAGFEPLAHGEIVVDGVPLAQIDASAWRAVVAWVPQDPHVPGATVREALLLGRRDITDDELRATLRSLDLDLDLDRPLGDDGGSLSAGQRRRLALARALVRQPLVLILDEPTAHLDAASEERILDVLSQYPATTLVATHRSVPADDVVTLRAPERFGV